MGLIVLPVNIDLVPGDLTEPLYICSPRNGSLVPAPTNLEADTPSTYP